MYYLAVLLGLAYERLTARHPGLLRLPLTGSGDPRGLTVALGSAGLCILFEIRSLLIGHAARDPRAGAWFHHVPIPPTMYAPALWSDPYRESISLGLLLDALVSSYLLLLIYRSVRTRGPRLVDRGIMLAACGIMLLSAFAAPAFISSDPYLYVGYGELGLRSYAAHTLLLACPDPSPSAWCKTPLLPATYGPLYLVYVHALLGHFHDLPQRLELLRLSNLPWVLLALAALWRLFPAQELLPLALLNPALPAQYVADPHNDIIPVSLLLVGALLARRFPPLTLLLTVAAGLIKAPLALIGTLAFRDYPLRSRLLWSGCTLGVTALLIGAWDWRDYAATLAYHRTHYPFLNTPLQCGVAIAAIALILAALLARRTLLSGAYAIPALGVSAHSWYWAWALPYLRHDGPRLATFLISLPVTSFLMEMQFQLLPVWNAIAAVLVGLTLLALAKDPTPRSTDT